MKKFVYVARTSDIDPGRGRTMDVFGIPVAVFNVEGQYYAVHDTCLRDDGSLGAGDLNGSVVTCPLHDWHYDVRTGQSVGFPDLRLRRYPVKIKKGDIYVASQPILDRTPSFRAGPYYLRRLAATR